MPQMPQKPGYKTSEWWLSLLAVLLGFLMSAGAFGEDSMVMKALGLATSALGALGYTVTRGYVKGKEATADAVKTASANQAMAAVAEKQPGSVATIGPHPPPPSPS